MANAMDVYPPRDLPGRADDWGRRVEAVSEDLYKSQVQLQQTLNNGQRATAGQLALLSRQLKRVTENQDDLLGRVSHFNSSSLGSESHNSSGDYPKDGAGVSFFLPEGRAVQILVTFAGATGTISSAGSSRVDLRTLIDGSLADDIYSAGRMYSIQNTPFDGSIVTSYLTNLAAGPHSVAPLVRFSSPGAGSYVICNAASTTVNVLQKTV